MGFFYTGNIAILGTKIKGEIKEGFNGVIDAGKGDIMSSWQHSTPLTRVFASINDSLNLGANSMLDQVGVQSNNEDSTRLVASEFADSTSLGTGYLDALKLTGSNSGSAGPSEPYVT